MKCDLKEIFKLKTMLDKENIPYEFYNYCFKNDYDNKFIENWQIVVPSIVNTVISIVEGVGTFGYKEDKLEIQGLLTDYEKEFDCVVGSLSADEVFQRIKEYDIKVQKNHNARDLYLKGIFGGIPTTEYIDFEEIKDTLDDWKETNGEET